MAGKDYAEEWFQAMNIISKKQLESLSFDMTIEATIIDASRAQDGIYTVSTGNANFLAYTTETGYQENDAVMVTVPQGDYNKQKIIVGKQVDDTDTPMIYKSPFQQLVNVSNNLISGKKSISMWANAGNDYGWDENLINFTDSTAFQGIGKNAEIWSGDIPTTESRYTRIGLKAQFSTWLNEYDTNYGNYGLVLILGFSNLDGSGKFTQTIVFDSDDFFGDPYNFETYYTQEAVFDISDFIDYQLKKVWLYAYQRNNFKNTNNEYIYTKEDLTNQKISSNIQPNIFIKDPYICLGIPTSEFSADSATIFTNSKMTYQKWPTGTDMINMNSEMDNRKNNNKKDLNLRWIHKDSQNDVIATVEEGEIPAKYHVWWYRYKLGAPSPDNFIGAHWVRYYGCSNSPDNNGDYGLTANQDIATDHIGGSCLDFYPNVNKNKEQLRAIIIKEEPGMPGFTDNIDEDLSCRLVAMTPIIEFTNENDVRSEATLIDENALSIRYDDEEHGNYLFYNRAGKIEKEKNGELRTLTAVFDITEENTNVYTKPRLAKPYNSIKWIFPASQTMIIPAESEELEKAKMVYKPTETAIQIAKENQQDFINILNNSIYNIKYNIQEDSFEYELINFEEDNYLISVGYYINDILDNNANRNTVRLEINKDGQLYTAQVNMLFGTAGTSGSDYTIAIEWKNNEKVFDIHGEGLTGKIVLYDQNRQKVNLETGYYDLSWYDVYATERVGSERKKIEFSPQNEIKDIYYPMANNKLSIMGNSKVQYLVGTESQNIFKYDVINKSFVATTNDEDIYNGIVYRKLNQNNNETMPIMEFRAFDEIIPVTSDSSLEEQRYRGTIQEENGKRIYYYDNFSNIAERSTVRPFVKYDDIYIIDPWNEYLETETYYEPILTTKKKYEQNNILNIQLAEGEDTFTISGSATIETDLYILEVALKNFGDYADGLIARFPIPLKQSAQNEGNKNFTVDYIEGPTDVRYATTGELDFKKNSYQIIIKVLNDNDPNNVTYVVGKQGVLGNNTPRFGHWELVYGNNNFEADSNFVPELIETLFVPPTLSSGKFKNPILKPPGVYFEQLYTCGVKFITDYNIYINNNNEIDVTSNEIDNIKIPKNTTLWMQPIYFYQDNYPSTTLNQWNGKDIQTNEDSGIISANGFSAGRKESNNTFTGVVLGDWSKDIADAMITTNTGVYGFYKGQVSYALKDDGTAFIGKSGKGRIYFNGDKAQIYSASWTVPKNAGGSAGYTQTQEGMLLDINAGNLISRKYISGKDENENNVIGYNITTIKPGYLEITGGSKILMLVSGAEYYLQSRDFRNENLLNNIDGYGLKIDLTNNQITGYNFYLSAGTSNDKLIIDSRNDKYPNNYSVESLRGKYKYKPLKINGNKFYVEWDGYLYSSYGAIGGWHITDNVLSSSDTNPTGTNAVYLNAHPASGQPNIYGAFIKGGTLEIGSNSINGETLAAFRVNTNGTLRIGGDTRNADNNYPSHGKSRFEVNSSGQIFMRKSDGTVVLSSDTNGNLTLTGTIQAKSGYIGNWYIVNDALYSNSSGTGNIYLSTDGLYMGNYFSVTPSGGLVASSGSIGGWTINSTSLSKGTVSLNSATGTISGSTIHGGSITGTVNAGNGTISGGSIVGSTLQIGYGQGGVDNCYALTISSVGTIRCGGDTRWSSGDFSATNDCNFLVSSTGNVDIKGSLTIGSEDDDHKSFYISSNGIMDVPGNIYAKDIILEDCLWYGNTNYTKYTGVSRVFYRILQAVDSYSGYTWNNSTGSITLDPRALAYDSNALTITMGGEGVTGYEHWAYLTLKNASGSARRFKENIQLLNNDKNNNFYLLQPVSFQYKKSLNQGDNIQYGFIAEDVLKIMPELVAMDVNDPNQTYGLYYNSILTLAVAEIQKLRKELDNIKLQIREKGGIQL